MVVALSEAARFDGLRNYPARWRDDQIPLRWQRSGEQHVLETPRPNPSYRALPAATTAALRPLARLEAVAEVHP